MTAIIVIILLAFPALCWWGWFHHWKKNKALMKENESLKIDNAKLQGMQNKHEAELALIQRELKRSKEYNALIYDKIQFYEQKNSQLKFDYQSERIFKIRKTEDSIIEEAEQKYEEDIDTILDKMLEERRRNSLKE